MEKNDIIVVAGVGGALALILWLASKNQNKADEVVMPYGWGSFQNAQYLAPENIPAPAIPEPAQPETPPITPWPGFSNPPHSGLVPGEGLIPKFKTPGEGWAWPPIHYPTPITPPMGIFFEPIEDHNTTLSQGFPKMSSVIKPVTGEKVI